MSQPTCGILVGEEQIIGERCADGGKCHHHCDTRCFRKECCVPLSASGLADDWAAPSIELKELRERAHKLGYTLVKQRIL